MTQTLAGKRIVNTRAVHQAAELDTLLRARGAEPLPYPCIAITPPDDTGKLDSALRSASEGAFDWLILTSVNTVFSLEHRLETMGLSLRGDTNLRVAAVGTSTAQATKEQLDLDVNLLPDEFTGESLAKSLKPIQGRRILLPASDIAPTTLADDLRASGAMVTRVAAYRTLPVSGGVDIASRLAEKQVDAVTFTSSSTVENFLYRLTREGGRLEHLDGVCIACIGPQTAQTARDSGLQVSVIPASHTLDGLVGGLELHFEHISTGAH